MMKLRKIILFLIVFCSLNSCLPNKLSSCNCRKIKKSIIEIEKEYLGKFPIVMWHKGEIGYDENDSIYKTPKLNSNILILNNCTNHKIQASKDYLFAVSEDDLNIWKKYYDSNCNDQN